MSRRIAPWIAFGLPMAYVGILLAVFIHEIVGHGLTAVLFGGEFLGFEVYPDGGGKAWTDGTGPVGRAWVLAGGVLSDVIFGALFLGLAALRRRQPRLRLVLLIFATTLFHDGLPYGLFGALLEGERGDISRLLLHLAPAPGLRPTLIGALGLLYLLTTGITSRALFRTLEDGLGPLSRAQATLIAGTMTVFLGVGYATFDWDTLIEGAGMYPTLTATLLQGSIGIWLVRSRRTEVERIELSSASWVASIALAWITLLACLTITLTWLRHGVEL